MQYPAAVTQENEASPSDEGAGDVTDVGDPETTLSAPGTLPGGGREPSEGGGRFGTFAGVFTPSVLTILGVIMYMRLGWVTGQGGLGVALAIVVVAHLITFATGLSVSSIATNRTVGAGGAYFMISRALGAPAGAAIGLPLFFAQALSVTFYIVGFTESVCLLLPESIRPMVPPWVVSTVVNVLITGLSIKSSELAIKAQYVVMVAIGVSLVAFFTGRSPDFPVEIDWVNENGVGFAAAFAVFFPAATGLMAGVSMSGELKDPRKSIPRGTMAAITVGFVVYMAFPIWFAMNYGNAFLVEHLDAAFTVASVPALIYVGVWGATLSSALGSVMTAPRTLQALANDRLAPRLFGRLYGANQEPVAGIVLTFLLSQTGIMVGSLDLIAPVLTMFFLATYGVTNLPCGLQVWAASPSFRPTFRVPSSVSLFGAAACFYVMSMIDFAAMVVAMFLCGVIFAVAQRRALGATYGDARHGIWAALVRTSLQRLRRVEFHPQNWRPNLIVFGGDPDKRKHMLAMGSSLVQDRGLVTYFHLLKGDVAEHALARKETFARHEPQIRDRYPNVFYRVDVASDVYEGAVGAAQSYGVGNFEANCVMLGWTRKPERVERYVRMLGALSMLDKALMVMRHVPESPPADKKERKRWAKRQRQIHVWLVRGDRDTLAMSLLLAYLVTTEPRMANAKITVLMPAETDAARESAAAALRDLLAAARIDASSRVVLRQGRSLPELMHVESDRCDMAIVAIELPRRLTGPDGAPLRRTPEGPTVAEAFVADVDAMLAELPTTLLVHGAASFGGEDVLVDTAGKKGA